MDKKLLKVLRFICIYGVSRTLVKILGRTRLNIRILPFLKFPFYPTSGKTVGIIGGGHHAFSTIAYYLTTSTNAKITFVIDINENAAASFAYAYCVKYFATEDTQIFDYVDSPDVVYISSNHASHTEYAIRFLSYGCDVFIEKPISVNIEQLNMLTNALKDTDKNIYVGYNRPHSRSIRIIKSHLKDSKKYLPFTLSCFVSGHIIPKDHWYLNPAEGSRIVSNLGHWIDLSIHILFWSKELIEYFDVSISYSDKFMPTNNIIVSMISSRHDLINITFTSRCEPFEGVNETINFQQGDLIAKIDDFRSTKIWKDDFYKKYLHWPKNNGHKAAVLQPFGSVSKREWYEIECSTRLILHIEEMVRSETTQSRFKFSK